MENNTLFQKVAVVTGSANGIGHATTQMLLSKGARVIGVDIEPQDHRNDNFTGITGDVSQGSTWQHISQLIKDKYDRGLDILVNNAGIHGFDLGPQNPEEISIDTWDKILNNNLKSVMLGCKAAIQYMPSGSAIINVGSRSGLSGVPMGCAYAASKAAIHNYTQSVALYLAHRGIRCVAVAPALVDTRMLDPIVGGKDATNRAAKLNELASTIPLNRCSKPDEIASLICFLASPEATYITGTTIVADGGILAGTLNAPAPVTK